MQREGLRQRIQYLIEHGGAYPEERRQIPRPLLFALGAILIMQATELALHLLR